jgi:hypothetical protein
MASILKKLLGDAGAGMDKSHGTDRLYKVLYDIVTQLNDQADQFNQLRTDYDAETSASHTATTATAITKLVTLE